MVLRVKRCASGSGFRVVRCSDGRWKQCPEIPCWMQAVRCINGAPMPYWLKCEDVPASGVVHSSALNDCLVFVGPFGEMGAGSILTGATEIENCNDPVCPSPECRRCQNSNCCFSSDQTASVYGHHQHKSSASRSEYESVGAWVTSSPCRWIGDVRLRQWDSSGNLTLDSTTPGDLDWQPSSICPPSHGYWVVHHWSSGVRGVGSRTLLTFTQFTLCSTWVSQNCCGGHFASDDGSFETEDMAEVSKSSCCRQAGTINCVHGGGDCVSGECGEPEWEPA